LLTGDCHFAFVDFIELALCLADFGSFYFGLESRFLVPILLVSIIYTFPLSLFFDGVPSLLKLLFFFDL